MAKMTGEQANTVQQMIKKPEVQSIIKNSGINFTRTEMNSFKSTLGKLASFGKRVSNSMKVKLCNFLIQRLEAKAKRTANEASLRKINKSIDKLTNTRMKLRGMQISGTVKLTPSAQREVAIARAQKPKREIRHFNQKLVLTASAKKDILKSREMNTELKKALAELNKPKRNMDIHGQVWTGKAAIKASKDASARETAMAKAAQKPKRDMKVWGTAYTGQAMKEAVAQPNAQETAMAKATQKTNPGRIAKKQPLVAFTKTETEILGKIGIPRAGGERKEFLRAFYNDVAQVASGKNIKADEPGARYGKVVNQYGKILEAQIRSGQTITASRAKSMMPQVLRNEARIAQAKTERKATTRTAAAPVVGYRYRITITKKEGAEGYFKSKPSKQTFVVRTKNVMDEGRVRIGPNKTLAQRGITIIKGNGQALENALNDTLFNEPSYKMLAKIRSSGKRKNI